MMLDSITTLILTVVGAFIAAVLHDRYKRPTPHYGFEFEKEVPYQAVSGVGIFSMMTTQNLENYIYLENYGAMPLFNISAEIHFDNKKERLHYQAMGITEKLFNLKIEYLPTPLPLEYRLKNLSLDILSRSEEEVIKEKTETGFFIDKSDMKKLKCLKSVKMKVKYEWDNKKDSDIWLADFSDENNVRFGILSPTIWRRVILFFKRRFL